MVSRLSHSLHLRVHRLSLLIGLEPAASLHSISVAEAFSDVGSSSHLRNDIDMSSLHATDHLLPNPSCINQAPHFTDPRGTAG